MKEKDDKIGDLVKRFNDMKCRELENNRQLILSNPDKVNSV